MFALMEATLVLATVAQHFRLRMMPNQEVVPLASITLRPKDGVAVRLESRRGAKSDLNIPTAVVNRI
jgi:cytochrome P450